MITINERKQHDGTRREVLQDRTWGLCAHRIVFGLVSSICDQARGWGVLARRAAQKMGDDAVNHPRLFHLRSVAALWNAEMLALRQQFHRLLSLFRIDDAILARANQERRMHDLRQASLDTMLHRAADGASNKPERRRLLANCR